MSLKYQNNLRIVLLVKSLIILLLFNSCDVSKPIYIENRGNEKIMYIYHQKMGIIYDNDTLQTYSKDNSRLDGVIRTNINSNLYSFILDSNQKVLLYPKVINYVPYDSIKNFENDILVQEINLEDEEYKKLKNPFNTKHYILEID